MSETLVTVQLRFEDVDRELVAERIGPVVESSAAAGAEHTSISIQDYGREPATLAAERDEFRRALCRIATDDVPDGVYCPQGVCAFAGTTVADAMDRRRS